MRYSIRPNENDISRFAQYNGKSLKWHGPYVNSHKGITINFEDVLNCFAKKKLYNFLIL